MAAYKNPSFQERNALAQQARQKALDQLRAKPPVDEAVLAERTAARLAREQAEAEARAAKLAAREQAKADKLAKAQEAEQTALAAVGQTEAEKQAARDARYAARKQRKGSR
jgi:hypothetical protein